MMEDLEQGELADVVKKWTEFLASHEGWPFISNFANQLIKEKKLEGLRNIYIYSKYKHYVDYLMSNSYNPNLPEREELMLPLSKGLYVDLKAKITH
jgi:hypothetical protein